MAKLIQGDKNNMIKTALNLSQQISLIESYIPDIKIDNITSQVSGWRYIITINNNLVFKFPKTDEALEKFKKEKYVADNIKNKISINVPKYKIEKDFSFFTLPEGINYFQYKNINGDFWNLRDTKKDLKIIPKIAKDLGVFLAEFHKIKLQDITENKSYGIQVLYDNYDYLVDLLKNINGIETLERTIKNYEKKRNNEIVLLNNHLNGSNFTIKNKVVSINDFELTSYGDFNLDFQPIFATSPTLFNEVVKVYENLTKRKIDKEFVVDSRRIILYMTLIDHAKNNRTLNIKGYYKMLKKMENK
jgi:hypothetical protein